MMKIKANSAIFCAAFLAGLGLVPARTNVEIFEGPTNGGVGVATSDGSRRLSQSRGQCFAISFGYSEASNKEAIAKSVADVSAYVCDPGPEDPKKVEEIASATATAYAIAVTEASVSCEGEGNVQFYANAYSQASNAAEVWLEAYAEATAAAGDCKKCSAFANSWGYVKKYVFLEALSESQATVQGFSSQDGIEFLKSSRDVNVNIQTATATAFAKAIAGAKKYKQGSECFAWVNAGGCIWDESADDPEQCFDCSAGGQGITNVTAIDALAEASAAAAAFTCGTNTSAASEAYVAASAIAEATAEAMSLTYAACSSGNGAYSCSISEVMADEAAKAVAEAFAEAWAGGYTCDNTCTVEAEAAAGVIEEILVTASTSALSELCADAGEQWTVEALAETIESASQEAIAEAIAAAVVGEACIAATFVNVIVQ